MVELDGFLDHELSVRIKAETLSRYHLSIQNIARLVITQDAASIVKNRLELLIRNGWQGLALATLTLLLLLSWRCTFWLASGLFVITLSLFPAGLVKFKAFPDLEGNQLEAPPISRKARFSIAPKRWWPGYSRVSRRPQQLLPAETQGDIWSTRAYWSGVP
jgi:hypothetical protein